MLAVSGAGGRGAVPVVSVHALMSTVSRLHVGLELLRRRFEPFTFEWW